MKVLRIAHHAVVSAWRERERELRRRGVRVELLSARTWNEGGRDVALEPGGDRFVHGVRTFGTHPALFLYAPGPLWRALRAGPDLIDLHEEPFALATAEMLAMRAVRRSRVPYVLYSAQNIDKRYPIPFRWFERYALRHAAAAYVCNVEAGEILKQKGLRGPAVLIPLGVDVESFRPADRTAPGERPVIGYVGRLEPHKGVAELLRAAASRPEWVVRVTGDGPQRGELEALSAQLGISDRVSFLGHAGGEALAARYRDLDVLAVPSIPTSSWLEQFCRVAVEAMASGVPVVASRTGAIPDVVGDVGVLVTPGRSDALASGIDEALEDWLRLRDAGLTRAGEFRWEKVAAQHGELYDRVVDTRDAGAGRDPEVVVVAYGSPDLLVDALAALDRRYPVTIVDNSSSAETEAIARAYSASYIDPGANVGFGAGVNVALDSLAERGLADRDVLLLNPDARITPDGVQRMSRLLHSDADLAAVGATQTEPGSAAVVRVWWPFPTPARAWREAIGLGRFSNARDFAIGSILMLRAEAIADVGRFDEQFFLYAEETDWQKRARDRGWLIDVAAVDATHIGGATSSDGARREELFFASMERFLRKHSGDRGWRSFRQAMILGASVRALVLRGAGRESARRRLDLFHRAPAGGLKDD